MSKRKGRSMGKESELDKTIDHLYIGIGLLAKRIENIEEDKIKAIGEFIEEIAKEHNISEYKVCQILGEDEEIPYAQRTLEQYRKIYKEGLAGSCRDISSEKLEIIATLDSEQDRELILERTKEHELSTSELREEVRNLKNGIPPEEKREDRENIKEAIKEGIKESLRR